MNLPKIKIGVQTHPMTKFNLSHDANTTADFGHVFPLTCVDMIPKAKVNMNFTSVVTVSPLVAPSFARIYYRIYNQFVRFSDLYEPFDNLYTQKPYSTSELSYTPHELPSVTPRELFAILQKYCIASIYKEDNEKDGFVGDTALHPFASNGIWNSFMTAIYGGDEYSNFFRDNFKPKVFNAPNQRGTGFPEDYFWVTPKGADFLWKSSTGDKLICWNLTDEGKRLYKVFQGLGYKVDMQDNTPLSILPLIGFAKCYYDIFAPQRLTTWTDTPFYKLMEIIRTYNYTTLGALIHNCSASQLNSINSVFDYLANTYYTDNQDYYSAHISTPAIAPDDMPPSFGSADYLGLVNPDAINRNAQPNLHDMAATDNSLYTATALQLLGKVSRLRNIATALGGDIKKAMRVLTGKDSVHNKDSVHISNFTVPIQISDIMSTTANEQVLLGSFAGQARANSKQQDLNLHCSFEAEAHGLWITLVTVVPMSGYCQGFDPTLANLTRYQLYNGSFDSLGYDITSTNEIYGQEVMFGSTPHAYKPFGFKPRYFEYKFHKNRVFGDMNLRSTRETMLPYSIDRIISTDEPFSFDERVDDNTFIYNIGNLDSIDVPIASEEWRYIGKYKWIGNYNRIFPNSVINPRQHTAGRVPGAADYYVIHDDPFILHNFIDVNMYAPMLPASESFDTEEGASKTIDVEKA